MKGVNVSKIARSNACFLEVAACSYEGFLFGWVVAESVSTTEGEQLITTQEFGFNCGAGQLKCVASSPSGKFLVAGGNDERVHIYNVVDRKSLGELAHHTGAITTLCFYQNTHLFSGSEDGSICVWRTYDWQCLHVLGGHKSTVFDFSVHPSGKLALSISKDSTMKLWNLVQGRCSFTRRLKQPADQVLWHESGEYYLIVSQRNVQLFAAADNNTVKATLAHDSRVNRAAFVTSSQCSESNSSATTLADWRIVTVCDNQQLCIFNFAGVQTASVDLSPLGLGRPRFVIEANGNMNAISSQTVRESLITSTSTELSDSTDDDKCRCIAIATSTGYFVLLSLAAVEIIGAPLTSNSSSSSGDTSTTSNAIGSAGAVVNSSDSVEAAVVAIHHVRGDPRFTALTALHSCANSRTDSTAVATATTSELADSQLEDAVSSSDDDSNAAAVAAVMTSKRRKVQFTAANSSNSGKKSDGKILESAKIKLTDAKSRSLFGRPIVTITEEDNDEVATTSVTATATEENNGGASVGEGGRAKRARSSNKDNRKRVK